MFLISTAVPDHLQEVQVPLLTFAECRAEWGSTVVEDNICAGTFPQDTTGVGTCQVLLLGQNRQLMLKNRFSVIKTDLSLFPDTQP